jgi:acyl-CoA thioesterase-1
VSGMLLRVAPWLLALALTGLPMQHLISAEEAKGEQCTAPAELAPDNPKLPALGERLRQKKPVKIVAIGGGSTAGAAAQSPTLAYPARLQEELAQRYPEIPVIVVNKGVPRQTAQEMLDRFASDVLPEAPTLVIWETGTTDAARAVEVEDFAATLESGIALLRDNHVDAMLVDMQYSRRTASIINFDRYLEAMRRVADVDEAYLFQRFAIMRYWSETGVFDYENVPKNDRAHAAAIIYDCIARRLADAIGLATQ